MKTGKRFTRILSMILSIALIFGMVPDMGLAVMAEGSGMETVISADAVSENGTADDTVSDNETGTVSGDEAVSDNEADTVSDNETDTVSEDETEEEAVLENEAEENMVSDDEAEEDSVSEDEAAAEGSLDGETEDLPEEVILGDGKSYDLWIGGVQVTDANKDDIHGVKGGKASYDPDNDTLTLSGVRGFKNYTRDYSGVSAYIYSGEGIDKLVIKGDMDVKLNDENTVIYSYNHLTFYADLKIETAGIPVMVRSERLDLWDGTYDLKVNSTKPGSACIKCFTPDSKTGRLFISHADVRAEGGEAAILSYGAVTIGYKANVHAQGYKYGIKCDDSNHDDPSGVRVEDIGLLIAKATGLRTDRSANDDGEYSGIWSGSKVIVTNAARASADGDNHGIYSKSFVTAVDSGRIDAVADSWSEVIPESTCFVGILAGDYVRIDDAYLQAAGNHGAVLAVGKNSHIRLERSIKVFPADAVVSAVKSENKFGTVYGETFINPKNKEQILNVRIEEEYDYAPKGYGLYVGDVEVNERNLNNIPVSKGHASYDPDTNTLTFDDAEIGDVTSYADTGVSASIYSAQDRELTIRGKLRLNYGDSIKYGIYCTNNDLNLKDADITAKDFQVTPICAANGKLQIIDSNIDVSSDDTNGSYGIYSGSWMTLECSYIRASGKKAAIYAPGVFVDYLFHKNETIKYPLSGMWKKDSVYENSGTRIAQSVVIEPESPYKLWIGSTPVTPENKGDITGNGKAIYNPETKTLLLNDPIIIGIYNYSHIYSGSDLRIEGNIITSTLNTGITCKGDLTLAGDIDISSDYIVISAGKLIMESGSCSLESRKGTVYAVKAGDIEIFDGDLNVRGISGGLFANSGGIRFFGGKTDIYTQYEDALGLEAGDKGKIEFHGGHVKLASSEGMALSAEPVISDSMCVIIPEDTDVLAGESEVEITDKDTVDCRVSFEMNGYGAPLAVQNLKGGDKVAKPADPVDENGIFVGWYKDAEFTKVFDFEKKVVRDTVIYAKWYPKEDYYLFVGDTYVSGDNCMDIYGDGTASYDPTNNTLTLKDYRKSEKYNGIDDEGNKAFIWAKQDLIVKGSATLSSNLVNIGIRSEEGSLTLDGDFDISVNCDDENGYAYAFDALGGDINIESGKINGTATGMCFSAGMAIGSGSITVNSGETKLAGTMCGIIGIMGSLEINDGILDAVSSYEPDGEEEEVSETVGILMLGGGLRINAGTVRAKGYSSACVFTTVSKNDEYIEIVKPEGGKLVKEGDGMVFTEADGKTYAKEVELSRRLCKVSCDLNGVIVDRVRNLSQQVYKGEKAKRPRKPAVNGYRFNGWYKEKECINEFDFENEIILEDTILYAGWSARYTVSFNVADADVLPPEPQTVYEGDTLTDPGMEDITGRKFIGWYKDEALTEEYDFATPVKSSFTLYAKWEKEKRSVSFNANGHGTAPDTVTVDYGDAVTEPEAPEAEGCIFLGWYRDESCISPYNFRAPVTENITLYAKWVEESVKTRTVSFDLNGMPGEAPSAQTVADGETILNPGAPSVEGMIFEGWYKDKECTQLYDFETAVTEDFTLYAKWTRETVKPDPGPDPVPDPEPEPDALLSALDPKPAIDDATSNIYLVKGQKFTLDESWSIKNDDKDRLKAYKKVISVSKKGAVNAKKAGDAVLVQKDVSGNVVRSLSVNVSVPSLANKKLKVEAGVEGRDSGSIALNRNGSIDVFYHSASPDVAVVDQNGNVTAVAKGSAKVTAYANGKAYTATVSVKEPAPVKMRTMHLFTDKSGTINFKGAKKAEWSCDDEGMVKIRKNKITALMAGTTVLRANIDGAEYKVKLIVLDPTIVTDGVEKTGNNKYKLTMSVTDRLSLKYSYIDQPVIYKSSKPDVAFIDEYGNIVPRGSGKTKFTAKLNGKTITINAEIK